MGSSWVQQIKNRKFHSLFYYSSPFLFLILSGIAYFGGIAGHRDTDYSRDICNFEYILDRGNQLGIDTIQQKDGWTTMEGCNGILGYINDPVWIRIKAMPYEKGMYLELEDPTQDFVDYYKPHSDGRYRLQATGDLRNVVSRELPVRTFVFSLGEINSFHYLRVHS